MSAPIGNNNAARWTREATLQILDRIEAIAMDEFSTVYTLTQALLRVRCYKQIWSYWKKKWEDAPDIMDRIYFIEQIFIDKLEEGALFRRMNASTCHFILRNNYGYNTKGEEELPSYLRQEFETEIVEKPSSGSKSKKEKAKPERTQYEIDYENDPAYKDFSPRASDDEAAAKLREDARRNPHLYTAKPPLRGNFMHIAEDLYAPI